MTRTLTLGAVLVALLVAASGLTGAVVATDATQEAVDSASLAQETTTDDASDDEDAADETTDESATDESDAAENASITFDGQPSNGSAVVVNETTLPEGGFVAVYVENGTVIGNSSYLDPGEHENVTVELDAPIDDTQVLVGVAHQDTNDDERFDFNVSEAEAAATTAEVTTAETTDETASEMDVTDGPYLVDDLPVTDVAYVVTGDDTLRRNETETDSEHRTAPLE